jgi:hypothetical protein
MLLLEFFSDIILRSYYGPGVDSASNRNEYQVYFLGVKAAGVRLTTLPPSCTVVMKSGNLNFLEPSGPLQACNGTDFIGVRGIHSIHFFNHRNGVELSVHLQTPTALTRSDSPRYQWHGPQIRLFDGDN